MVRTILILDPAGDALADLRAAFSATLSGEWRVQTVTALRELTRHVETDGARHLIVLHEQIGDGTRSGLELIRKIRRVAKDVPVVLVADEGNVEAAAQAVQAGATDFLVRGDQLPQRIATLLGKLHGLMEVMRRNRQLDEQNAGLREAMQARCQIVGQSPQIRRLLDQIERVAQVPRPVLITGERGTGKELVARAVHGASKMASGPMVVVNCAAFSDSLLESELFGHEKGAFTGADTARRGKFEQADHGTLFLDEIGNMSLVFQQKILRVVEYGTFSRVGGSGELKTRARIIAATNVDLNVKIHEAKFLPDLLDRLAFEIIDVPPLRCRQGDVDVLAHHFLQQFSQEIPAFAGKTLSRNALKILKDYSFPGNVRELKNIIERAAYRDTGGDIRPEDLGLIASTSPRSYKGSFQERVDSFRKRLLVEAMTEAKNNQAEAARILGLSYHRFRYLYKKHVG